ncbi:MAG: hypothetical protein R3Y06_00380 [Faecalibacterium sp.]
MNSIERMVNTIQRKPVDRLPVYPLINSVSRKAQIDVLGKGGGFVLATGCEYPAPLDFEKARLMVELAKNTPVTTE